MDILAVLAIGLQMIGSATAWASSALKELGNKVTIKACKATEKAIGGMVKWTPLWDNWWALHSIEMNNVAG